MARYGYTSRRRGGAGWLKAVSVLLVIALLAAAGIVFVPRLVHQCDKCAGTFVGTGYSANVVTDLITDLTGRDAKILCRECAMKEHALAIAAGASLKDYQLPLFETEEDGQ